MARQGSLTDLLIDGFTSALFGKKETTRLPVRTSSNQAEAVYLPTAAPGLGDSGVIIGREVYSGKGYVYDPFQLYGQQLPAPHWLVLGESGNGKSSLEKTYVLRQLRFKDRQVVVLDAQGEDGVGEWNRIAEAVGVTPIRLDPHARGGIGIRLNPLDPAITQTGQLALLRTIVEVALGRTLDERSGYALKAAQSTVRAEALKADRQPILHDIVDALRDPKQLAAEDMNVTLDEVRDWGLDVALVLDRLVDGDLAGMFDGPTTGGIDLDSPLIVFDLSTIDRNSIAMPILMAIVGVWLEHTWIKPDRRKRILLVEEAWHIINSPSVAQLFQRLLKFGRRLGLSFVAVVHHLSDVVDGAAAREAAAILKMASTRTIYMQKSDEAKATGKVLGLPRWAVEIIPTLSPGIAVWDVNGDVQVVKHIVTEIERPLVYTDRAMTETSAEQLASRFQPLAADEVDDTNDMELADAVATRAVPANGAPEVRPPSHAGRPAALADDLDDVVLYPRADAAGSPAAGARATAGPGAGTGARPQAPAEDSDIAAVAAAIFGPRANLPSHQG
jgi:DNA helicase HerA-like ATPase